MHTFPPSVRLLAIQNADRLDSEIRYDRDFDYDYFGFKVSRPVMRQCDVHVCVCVRVQCP